MQSVTKRITTALAACLLTCSCLAPASAAADDNPAKLFGDVNEDQTVDVSDAVLLARFAAEDTEVNISAEGKKLADVNQDGGITSDDTLWILQYIAKLRDTLGVKAQEPQQNSPAVNLTKDIKADDVAGKKADQAFISAQLGFTANLLRETDSEVSKKREENEPPKNLLISPLSVSLALGMTANGAKGETLAQMEKTLSGSLGLDNLNAYYADYVRNLPSTDGAEVHIANSIWARDNQNALIVPESFLKATKSYYNADYYKAPFDRTTVDDINGWVNENTKEMIPKLIDIIGPNDLMYLINAVAFEANWADPYKEYQVHEDDFTLSDGKTVKADFMFDEMHSYLDDGKAIGFVKEYKDWNYSFAAVLPNEGISVADYIKEMDAESLQKLLNNEKYGTAYTWLPKFSFDFSTSLKPALQAMGMELPFSEGAADFTGLNEIPDTYISDVLHKTFIEVDEGGTKAAAVTAVIMAGNAAAPDPEEPKEIRLDRPFIFMILDNSTNLPVFIGYVMDPTQEPA